jgi:hypothetical protein
VWPPFALYIATHLVRVDQAVDCGLWNVVPLLFNFCVKLLNISTNWNTLSYTSIQSIPNMLNGWHVWWVRRPWNNWEMFSFQELRTDPCDMGPCIIMLKHEVMVADKWHDNGSQVLVTLTQYIQIAIDKMYWCLLSVAYACPYHNPTIGHSVHNVTSENRSPTSRRGLQLRPVSLKWCWRWLMVDKWTWHSLATALVDIPAVSMSIAHTLKTWHLWYCVVWLHILEWPFIVPSTRCTCVMIMPFNLLSRPSTFSNILLKIAQHFSALLLMPGI